MDIRTDPQQVEMVRVRREAYHAKNDNIAELVKNMKENGYSAKDIAIAANKQRNLNRLNDYIDDPYGLESLKKRNLELYGLEDGSAAESLYEKYGSWEKVTEKAMSANPAMDACCGLYDKYYHLYGLEE